MPDYDPNGQCLAVAISHIASRRNINEIPRDMLEHARTPLDALRVCTKIGFSRVAIYSNDSASFSGKLQSIISSSQAKLLGVDFTNEVNFHQENWLLLRRSLHQLYALPVHTLHWVACGLTEGRIQLYDPLTEKLEHYFSKGITTDPNLLFRQFGTNILLN